MSYQQTPPGPSEPDNVPTAQQQKRRVPGSRMLITGIILLGLSIIGGIIAVGAFAVSMVNSFSNFGESTYTISEPVAVDGLGDNHWYIYQDPGAMTAECSVIDEQGNDIVQRSGDMSFSNNEFSLEAFQSFESTADGVYEIQCSQYPVVLGGSVPVGSIIGMVVSIVLAVLLFIAGLILTIIGAVRRSRAKRSQTPPAGGNYPPGSYPGYGYQQGPQPPSQPGPTPTQ